MTYDLSSVTSCLAELEYGEILTAGVGVWGLGVPFGVLSYGFSKIRKSEYPVFWS